MENPVGKWRKQRETFINFLPQPFSFRPKNKLLQFVLKPGKGSKRPEAWGLALKGFLKDAGSVVFGAREHWLISLSTLWGILSMIKESLSFSVALVVKNTPANAGDERHAG